MKKATSVDEIWLGLVGRELVRYPDVHDVIVHCDRLGRIDVSGALVLRHLLEDSASVGVTIVFVDVPTVAKPVVNRVFGDLPVPLHDVAAGRA